MGDFQVVFSPYVELDLERIVRHIARDNPGAAVSHGDRLIDRSLSLSHAESVHIGAIVQKRPGVRKLVEGNYLIFYRVIPEERKLRILRFWHGARKQKGLRLKV